MKHAHVLWWIFLGLLGCKNGPVVPAVTYEEIFSYSDLETDPLAPLTGERYFNSHTGLQSTGWGVYEDIIFSGTDILWEMSHAQGPGRSDTSLWCAITGGDRYNNVFFTHTLAMAHEQDPWPYEDLDSLVFELDFYVEGSLDCENPDASTAEGLEFTWQHILVPTSYGFGVQWSKGGEWRYYDDTKGPDGKPLAWRSFDPAITTCLSAHEWHHLLLTSVMKGGEGIAYREMHLDGAVYDLGSAEVGPATVPDSWVENFLQVGMQINGNQATDPSHGHGLDPVEVYLDRVELRGFVRIRP